MRTFALVAIMVGLSGVPSFAGAPQPATSPAKAEVALKDENGALLVPVTINGAVRLDFTLDSGASVVSIPADVAMTLMRTGTITREDFLGNQTFQLADGSTVPSTILRIRSLKVGDVELHDVAASVSDVKGALLLGETFLARLSSWSVDNQRHVLILGPEIPGSATALALKRPSRSHHRQNDEASASHAAAPGDPPSAPDAAGAGSARAETGADWDGAFYQVCIAPPEGSGAQPSSPALCHCIGAQLQPLSLARKKRLRPHSHEVLAAIEQCQKH
jgi:clan AA aspartic protease (TIGR02281 family)